MEYTHKFDVKIKKLHSAYLDIFKVGQQFKFLIPNFCNFRYIFGKELIQQDAHCLIETEGGKRYRANDLTRCFGRKSFDFVFDKITNNEINYR